MYTMNLNDLNFTQHSIERMDERFGMSVDIVKRFADRFKYIGNINNTPNVVIRNLMRKDFRVDVFYNESLGMALVVDRKSLNVRTVIDVETSMKEYVNFFK